MNPEAGEKPVPTMHESMFWTNFSGFIVAGILSLATGQLFEGVDFCRRHTEVSTPLNLRTSYATPHHPTHTNPHPSTPLNPILDDPVPTPSHLI